MRADLQTLERIEAYLNGFMTSLEKEQFETELNNSSDLQTLLENQKLIQQAVARKAIMAQVHQFAPATISSISFWTKFRWPIILSSILLVALVGFSFVDMSQTEKENNGEVEKHEVVEVENGKQEKKGEQAIPEQSVSTISSDSVCETAEVAKNTNSIQVEPSVVHSLNKTNIDLKNFASIEMSMPDIGSIRSNDVGGLKTWITPKKQIFTINPNQSNTIECKDGTVIIVPQNAFCTKDGTSITENVELEIVEALTMADMIAYNLTTMNDGKALKSGGMLYIQPLVNGEKVSIKSDRPMHIEVPTNKVVPNMVAWKGEVNAKGDINWVEPKDLEKFLVPVAFNTLDLKPNGFSNAVEAGLPFKTYTRSSPQLIDSLYYSLSGLTSQVSEVENNFSGKGKFMPVKVNTQLNNPSNFNSWGGDGGLFKRSFITVIKVKNISSEDLAQSKIEVQGNKEGDFCEFYVSGNSINIFKKASKNGLHSISIQTKCSEKEVFTNIPITISGRHRSGEIEYAGPSCKACFLDPIGIKTVISNPFENTFISTKEFETRLKELHTIPEAQKYYNLYITNLTKNLYEVDQIVADQLSDDKKSIFQTFADQKLTNVDNDNINQDAIKAYYNASRAMYQKEVQRTNEAYRAANEKDLKELQSKLQNVETNYADEKAVLASNTSQKSFSFPSISLGFNKNISIPKLGVSNSESYKVAWNSTGWMNIDCYLHLLGKNDVIVEINSKEKDNDVKVYQCINVLKTIIPLAEVEGKMEAHFPEKGKEGSLEMKDTYCVGIHKDKDQLYYSEKQYNPYSENEIQLEWNPVTERELYNKLVQLSPINDVLAKSLKEEIRKITLEQEYRNEKKQLETEIQNLQNKIAKENAFIQSLIDKINPCDPDFCNEKNYIHYESKLE